MNNKNSIIKQICLFVEIIEEQPHLQVNKREGGSPEALMNIR